jgi:release factor glutamine methyltransferase
MNKSPADNFSGTNITDALRHAVAELKLAGVDSPKLTAEILLAQLLGWDRVRILSHGDEILPAHAGASFAAAVSRRAAGEPLQYIIGNQEFFGLIFRVTNAVLIPRPETEILVEKALQLARGMERERILFADIGTGSGCIAVALVHSENRASGWACDLSADALLVAGENAYKNGVAGRVGLVRSDLMECFSEKPVFDFVLSNPPYVARQDESALPVLVRDHEPEMALFAGETGMDIYCRLVPQAAARLAPGGYLLMEVGYGMSAKVEELIRNSGLSVISVEYDLQSIPRCVIARRGNG